MDPSIFDKRVVRRNIRKGLITQQDYLDHLSGLEDRSDACEPVEEQLYPKDEEEQNEGRAETPSVDMS